jgi:hypothetical protein
MSRVTNIIITSDIAEEECGSTGIIQVNEWLADSGYRPFHDLSDSDHKLIGGNRALEAHVYVGAFNYFDLREFANAVCKAHWAEPDNVRVFIQDQEKDCFAAYRIADSRLIKVEGE